jgi:hypothetical protein
MYTSKQKFPPFRGAVIGGAAMIIIGAAAYEFFEAGFYQPEIAGTGSVTSASKISSGRTVKAKTRLAAVGRRSFWQVEVSPGVWKDCGSDCAEVLRHWAFQE